MQMIKNVSERYDLVSSILLFVCCYFFFENYFIVSMKTSGLDQFYYLFSIFKLMFFYGLFFILLVIGFLNANFIIRLRVVAVFLYVIFLFFVGFFLKANGVMAILSFQNMYLWVFLLSFLYLLPCKPNLNFFKILMPIIIILMFAHFFYSLWIQATYNGNYNQFYFYELYSNLNMFSPWNHIKNGDVRAYGFFGSSTGLSQVLFIPICYLISCCILNKNLSILYFILLIIFIYFLYITKIRNPALALCFVMLFFLILKCFKVESVKVISIVLITLFLLSFTIAPISDILGVGDLSSQARTPMLLSFIDNITANPMGYGVGSTGNLDSYQFFYESSFATIVNDLGIIYSIPLFTFLLFLISSFYRIYLYGSYYYKLAGLTAFLSLSSLFFLMNYSNIFDFTLNIYIIFLYACFAVFKTDRVRF